MVGKVRGRRNTVDTGCAARYNELAMKSKTMFRLIGWAMLAACCLAPAQDSATAEDEPTPQTTAKEKKVPKGLKPVAKAIAEMDSFNAEPNYKAKYYIYLESASWCGPCKAEMPHIVKAYPEMKKKKVEILLVGADRSPEAAEKYLKSFNAEFPGVWGGDELVKNLPGYKRASYVPHAVFVDEKGNVIEDGNGGLVKNWEAILFKKKKKKK